MCYSLQAYDAPSEPNIRLSAFFATFLELMVAQEVASFCQ